MKLIYLRLLVVIISALLAIMGIVELAFGLVILSTSSGNFSGGLEISSGFVCFLAGWLGACRCASKVKDYLLRACFMAFPTCVLCFISVFLQSGDYDFARNVESCASFNSGRTSTCQRHMIGYECFGNENYFDESQRCLLQESIRSNGDCSCVVKGNSDCFTYTGVENCSAFISKLPHQLKACFIIAIILLVMCSIQLGLMTAAIMLNRDNVDNEEDYTIVAPVLVFEDEGL